MVDRLRQCFKTKDLSVLVSIGDDTAVVRFNRDKDLLYTCDMLVESVHFKKNEDYKKVGYKAMAVSVSDIAAKGGVPRYALVSVGLPSSSSSQVLRVLTQGINSCAKKFNISVIGGDMNRSRHAVIDIFMVGEVEKRNLVLRSNAQVGDWIFVSGPLGGSLEGKHLSFTPRLKEAQYLVKNFKINAMMDLSDGLGLDLNRLAQASRLGALIFENKIPVSTHAAGLDAALFDGEDFELLFTLTSKEALRLLSQMNKHKEFKWFCIGRMTDLFNGVRMTMSDGRTRTIPWRGFEHFK